MNCVKYSFLLILSITLVACKEKSTTVVTPWGTTISTDGERTDMDSTRTDDRVGEGYSLDDIKQGGEMIMLTLYGPETFYDHHGRSMGVHYLLCQSFAEHLGVRLRVDVCRDTTEMLSRLRKGEADIIAYPLNLKKSTEFVTCAAGWTVNNACHSLAEAVKQWYTPAMLGDAKKQEQRLLSAGSPYRYVFPCPYPDLHSSPGLPRLPHSPRSRG